MCVMLASLPQLSHTLTHCHSRHTVSDGTVGLQYFGWTVSLLSSLAGEVVLLTMCGVSL